MKSAKNAVRIIDNGRASGEIHTNKYIYLVISHISVDAILHINLL